MKITTSTKLTEKQLNTILDSNESASQKMIKLFNAGLEVSEIAKLMEKRYNHVYNVVTNAVNTKKIDGAAIEYSSTKGESKKSQIIALYNQGTKKSDIAKQLGIHAQQVYQVLKGVPEPTTDKKDEQAAQ